MAERGKNGRERLNWTRIVGDDQKQRVQKACTECVRGTTVVPSGPRTRRVPGPVPQVHRDRAWTGQLAAFFFLSKNCERVTEAAVGRLGRHRRHHPPPATSPTRWQAGGGGRAGACRWCVLGWAGPLLLAVAAQSSSSPNKTRSREKSVCRHAAPVERYVRSTEYSAQSMQCPHASTHPVSVRALTVRPCMSFAPLVRHVSQTVLLCNVEVDTHLLFTLTHHPCSPSFFRKLKKYFTFSSPAATRTSIPSRRSSGPSHHHSVSVSATASRLLAFSPVKSSLSVAHRVCGWLMRWTSKPGPPACNAALGKTGEPSFSPPSLRRWYKRGCGGWKSTCATTYRCMYCTVRIPCTLLLCQC